VCCGIPTATYLKRGGEAELHEDDASRGESQAQVAEDVEVGPNGASWPRVRGGSACAGRDWRVGRGRAKRRQGRGRNRGRPSSGALQDQREDNTAHARGGGDAGGKAAATIQP